MSNISRIITALILLVITVIFTINFRNYSVTDNSYNRPTRALESQVEDDNNEEHQWRKIAPWTKENAAHHQEMLKRYAIAPSKSRGFSSYANGAIAGSWRNRGAKNMPGAFKFTEMLDGTDTIYGVTHNHYSGEFNSKSIIFKGTVYNPKSGTKGDDFVAITSNWPNRYRDLIVFKYNNRTRIVAGIENGPVYYSDNDGQTWTLSTGLPTVVKSTIANRQDNNTLYATDGRKIYSSTNGGESFSEFQDFGNSGYSVLYSPRYSSQPNASNVYFAKDGKFYTLTPGKSAFVNNGTYATSQGEKAFSIGGDSRKLYVTENSNFWVSTSNGTSWSQKYPHGNYYGDRTGTMSAGMKICVSPENGEDVIGGYAQPVFSTDGLSSDISTDAGWGGYQGGTNLSTNDYYNKIRFNYHPDFQSSSFFYNSSGDLFSAHSTDGGIFISYKAWVSPSDTIGPDNTEDYSKATYINITTLNTTSALIYRNNMFTGKNDETHIIYSTQDQGAQSIIPGTTGESLDFYQSIGGDGPPLNSTDGDHVWMWQREGEKVWAPASMYDKSGNMLSAGSVKSAINSNSSTTFTKSTNIGWVQTYIDHDAPANRMWVLSNRLDRAEVSGSSITGSSISKGTGHQVAAIAQGHTNADLLWFLQEGIVYKSINRGDSFDNGSTTPFTKTSNRQNFGGGWVLPTNDNYILFCGPSANGVGSILSKDGGATWTDVTGNFPAGDDQQTGGVVGTPDGKYIFAGTDIGPWVFVVANETWYPIGDGAGNFNTTAIEYIKSTNTVRFGTWGAGVWDFVIDDGVPSFSLNSINNYYNINDTVTIKWLTNQTGTVTAKLMKNGTFVQNIGTADASLDSLIWIVGDTVKMGSNYSIEVTLGSIADTTNSFSIIKNVILLNQKHLSIKEVDSEHSADRAAKYTIDGDSATFWHTEWSPNVPDFPHFITYELDTTVELAAFGYLARPGGGNGTVKTAQIRVSDDNLNWTTIFNGSVIGDTIFCDSTIKAKFVQFYAMEEINGNAFASMAEFNLYYIFEDVVSIKKLQSNNKSISLMGISRNSLKLSVPKAGSYKVSIHSINGRLIYSQAKELNVGLNNIVMDNSYLAKQVAIITVSNGINNLTQKISIK